MIVFFLFFFFKLQASYMTLNWSLEFINWSTYRGSSASFYTHYCVLSSWFHKMSCFDILCLHLHSPNTAPTPFLDLLFLTLGSEEFNIMERIQNSNTSLRALILSYTLHVALWIYLKSFWDSVQNGLKEVQCLVHWFIGNTERILSTLWNLKSAQ